MIAPVLSRILLGSVFLCVSLCGCPEEDDFESIQVIATDLTKVEEPARILNVGDVLYINTTIPFVLPTQSSGNIDFRELGINEETVGFSMVLFKKSGSDTYSIMPLNDNLIIQDVGNTMVDQDMVIFKCLRTDDGYENRAGITFNQPGTYQLRSTSFVPAIPIFYNLDQETRTMYINLEAYLAQSSSEQGDFTFVVQ